MTIAKVEPITKDRIVIRLSKGYSFVSFKLPNGGAEIVILDKDATETTRLAVAPPVKGRKLWIEPTGDSVELIYRDE
jgi:hypothetical protein